MLRAAFGKFDFTPPPGARLGRTAHNAFITQGVRWPLHLRAALFDDGSQRAAVVALDHGFVSTAMAETLREAMRDGAGVAPTACMVAATHAHNGPALSPWQPRDNGFVMLDSIADQLRCLGKEMAGRLAPVKLVVAQTEAPGWSFSRRSIYRLSDGHEWVSAHGRRDAPGFVGTEGPDESALRAVFALRPDGSTMGGLINFWCHPTTMYREPVWSADFPGPLLDRVEQRLGGDFVYLTGPAGDLSPSGSQAELCQRMGEALADKAIAAMASGQPVLGDTVRIATEIVSIAQRMVTPAQLAAAREYLGRAPETKPDPAEPSLPMRLYGWPFHMASGAPSLDRYFAEETIGMWEWQRRAGQRVLREMVEMQAIGVGDLALAAFPCELFSTLGHELLDRSPVRHTLAVEQANARFGYVPPEESFTRGGYECCLALTSRLEPRAGHTMVETSLRLLHQLAANPPR